MTIYLRAALLVALLSVAGCSRSGTTAAPPTASMTVTVAEAARRSVQREVVASGSVAAWQEMSLGVELSGLRIADVRVEPGAQVVAGQALLELDRRTLDIQARQAEASLAQARASLELARAQAVRGEALLAQNLISSADHDGLRQYFQQILPARHLFFQQIIDSRIINAVFQFVPLIDYLFFCFHVVLFQ